MGFVDEEVNDFLKEIGLSQQDEEIIQDEVRAELDSEATARDAEQAAEDEAEIDLDELQEAEAELVEASDVVAEAANAEMVEVYDEMDGDDVAHDK